MNSPWRDLRPPERWIALSARGARSFTTWATRRITPPAWPFKRTAEFSSAATTTTPAIGTSCGFLGDGSVDTSFGSNGQVALSGVNAQAGVVSSLAVQPNGQILAGGTFGGSNELGVVRIKTDGTLESSFGNAGFALDGMADSSVWDLALQPDGSILAAGFAGQNAYEPGHSGNYPALARLTAGDVAGAVVDARSVAAGSPVLSLSGDSTATAGTPYTLTIGDGGSDLGAGGDVSYVVHWGDGQTTTVSADALVAQQGEVTHTYNTTSTGITVDLDVVEWSLGGVPSVQYYSNIGSQTVSVDTADATTTGLTVSPPSPGFGQAVTLTATVSPLVAATGIPTGTVEFYDGTTDLGPGTLSIVGGQDIATLVTPPLSYGDHAFTAVYSGEGTFDQSNSAVEDVMATSGMAGTAVLSGSTTATVGGNYNVTLPTTDSQGNPMTITQWTINWGDGTPPTVVSGSPTSPQSHVYQSPGDYLVQAIAATSAGGYSATLNNQVTPQEDTGFGSALAPLPLGSGEGISDLAVQPDGSIVAVASGAGVSPASPLVRFDSSGQPDGTVFDDMSASIATITSVAVQPVAGGFEILAAGSCPLSSQEGQCQGFRVARFNSDGSLDTSFGGDGIASFALPPGDGAGQGGQTAAVQILVEPDGEIVLAGIEPDASIPTESDLVLGCFAAGGQPDDTFGTAGNGIVTYPLAASAASCEAAIQPGGAIVAAVGLSSGSTEVLRFTSGGQIDMSFGNGTGHFTTAAISGGALLAIQPDGEIDLAGANGSGGFAAQQYAANGGGGAEWTDLSAGTGVAEGLAVEPSGRIVVASVDSVMGSNAWSLSGLSDSGSPLSWGEGQGEGIEVSEMTGPSAALAIQPNGNILLGGQAGATDAFFARYGADNGAVKAADPDASPQSLNLTYDGSPITGPIAYSGADTEDGGNSSPVEVDGSFTDPGTTPEAHTVTINWGDNSQPTTIDLDATETTFSCPLPQYAVNGPYTVSVTVADADGADPTPADCFTVNYGDTQPSEVSLSLDQPIIAPGGAVTLSGSFNDPQSNLAHCVTIDWGDGTGSTHDITTLSLDAGETSFQADPHTYATGATTPYTIQVTVSGLDGASAPATTTVNVVPMTSAVTASSLTPAYGQTVTLTTTIASSGGGAAPTGTVDFYDTTTGTDLGSSTLNSAGAASLAVSGLGPGAHSITATYSGDGNFPTSQSTLSVTVVGQPVSIGNISLPATIDKGDMALLSADVNGLDGAGFTLKVDWGANQTSDTIAYPAGTTSFTLTHHYVDDGGAKFNNQPFDVVMTVTADNAQQAMAEKTIMGLDVATPVYITGEPSSITYANQSITVNAVVADPGEFGTYKYAWTATAQGGGDQQTGDASSFPFVAHSDVSYKVSLTVTDPDGQQFSQNVTIPGGQSGGTINGFVPDQPTVTIEETDPGQTVDAGSVRAFRDIGFGERPEPRHRRRLLHDARRQRPRRD